MRISWFAFSSICCLFARVLGAEYIPDCSLTCLGTIVPEICGSLTNVTCLCTNVVLAAELLPCIATACNVTDSLAVEKYQADTCGVEADRTRLNEQLRLYYIMPALTVIFVALRFAARLVVDVGIKADDYMMLAAEIAFLADVGTGLVMALNDFGEHTYSLTTHQLQTSLKFFYISELFYIVTLTFTKLSLLLFFRRIFPNQKFNQAVWIVIGFVATSNFSMLMALTFQCLPFHGNWTNWMYKVAPVKCINSYAAIFTLAGLSIAHDLIILIMPLPTLWSLHLAWQKKLNLLVMFSIGSFVIVCSLIRLPSLLKLQKSSDPSYDQAPIAVWTHLEQSVGIICGCLPACRSLVGWAFPGLKMKLESSKETSKYGLGYSKNSKVVSRTDRGDRDFIELDEQLSEENGSERGRAMSVKSQESQIPFGDSLVPAKGKNMGSRTYVNVTENPRDTSRGRHQRRELSNGGEGGGITLTTSVYLTEQRSGPGR